MLPPQDKWEKCYDASPVRVGRRRQSARDSRRLTAVPLQKQEQEGYRIPIPPALTCPSFCSLLLTRNRRHYLLSVPIPSSISGSPLRSNDQGDHLSPLVHDGHSSPLASSSPAGPRRLSHSFIYRGVLLHETVFLVHYHYRISSNKQWYLPYPICSRRRLLHLLVGAIPLTASIVLFSMSRAPTGATAHRLSVLCIVGATSSFSLSNDDKSPANCRLHAVAASSSSPLLSCPLPLPPLLPRNHVVVPCYSPRRPLSQHSASPVIAAASSTHCCNRF
ncbi:hypothetical protein BHE74_00025884 [Ensete ventricosum]|nr:hypothetical protein GW17_00012906 [Ensete ventricosum]RWW66729.1 hypothetical protein BHE74_00025884 [Ensete ventricosum]